MATKQVLPELECRGHVLRGREQVILERVANQGTCRPALAAAAFFMITAIGFATAVILSPAPRLTPISAVQGPS